MPTYLYRCSTCKEVWEEQRTMINRDDHPDGCPNCTNDYIERIYQPTAVAFKGSGFYSTDNRKN